MTNKRKILQSKDPPPIWPETHKEAAALRARKAPKLEMFTAFELTKDPQARKYMLFNEIVYPKINRKVLEPFREPELDSLWMAGFLDEAHRAKVKAMLELAGIDPSSISDTKPTSHVSSTKATPSGPPEVELDDEGRPINRKLIPTIKDTSMALKMSRRAYAPPKVDPAVKQKEQIKQMQQQNLKVQPEFRSSDMDRYYELARKEHECAFRIQRIYRRYVVWKRWHQNWEKYLAAVKIQALIRGVITRRFIAVWYLKYNRVVTQWQARARRCLTQIHCRMRLNRERKACVKIQATVLMYLGKRRAYHRRAELAAQAIQRLWRGVVGRGIADRKWLDLQATLIQKQTRRHLAQGYYRRRRAEMLEATAKVQRAFRGFRSRKTRNNLLQTREMEYRKFNAQFLSAEEEFLQSKLNLMLKRLAQTRIRERYDEAKERFKDGVNQIDQLETEYLGFHRKRRMMSPREFSAGWDKNYTEGIEEFRKKISQAKLDLVLETALQARKLQEELAIKDELIQEIRMRILFVERWRDAENVEILEDEKKKKFDDELAYKKLQIAEQRRRWKVRFYRESGKPDKRRPRGRPWDPSVYAGIERDIFCGGTADLLALNNEGLYRKLGSNESLKLAVDQLYLQSFISEVEKNDRVLQPLITTVRACMPTVVSAPCDPPAAPSVRRNQGRGGSNYQTTDSGPEAATRQHTDGFSGGHVLEVYSVAAESDLNIVGITEASSSHDDLPPDITPDVTELPQAIERADGEQATAGNDQLAVPASASEGREDGADGGSDEDGDRVSHSAQSSSSSSTAVVPQLRRLPAGYHTVHPRRLQTDMSLWPLKEAEARITISYSEQVARGHILNKYEDRISRRFRAPVTRVPWSLVDELEVERIRWEVEKSKFDRHIYERMSEPLRGRTIKGSAAAASRSNS